MKSNVILYTIIIAAVLGFSGCGGNRELKKDAKDFADAMCRNIETMQKLRAANPADTVLIQKIQKEQRMVDSEMMVLSMEFKKKYGEKTKSPKFVREYRKYLNKSMLDCQYLTKEDRANFEKEVN